MTADARAGVLADLAVALIAWGLVGLVRAVGHPHDLAPDSGRSAATVLLGFALYVQARGDHVGGLLSPLIALLALWASVKLRHLPGATVEIVRALLRSEPVCGRRAPPRAWRDRGEGHVAAVVLELAHAILWLPAALGRWLISGSAAGNHESESHALPSGALRL